MTEADKAYIKACEVCDRLLAELNDEIKRFERSNQDEPCVPDVRRA